MNSKLVFSISNTDALNKRLRRLRMWRCLYIRKGTNWSRGLCMGVGMSGLLKKGILRLLICRRILSRQKNLNQLSKPKWKAGSKLLSMPRSSRRRARKALSTSWTKCLSSLLIVLNELRERNPSLRAIRSTNRFRHPLEIKAGKNQLQARQTRWLCKRSRSSCNFRSKAVQMAVGLKADNSVNEVREVRNPQAND